MDTDFVRTRHVDKARAGAIATQAANLAKAREDLQAIAGATTAVDTLALKRSKEYKNYRQRIWVSGGGGPPRALWDEALMRAARARGDRGAALRTSTTPARSCP